MARAWCTRARARDIAKRSNSAMRMLQHRCASFRASYTTMRSNAQCVASTLHNLTRSCGVRAPDVGA
eukprot:6707569-Lingulodinium_polyedra.AAC.1